MLRTYFIALAAIPAAVFAVPAAAQTAADPASEVGPYGVARAGVAIDTDYRFRDADVPNGTRFSRDVDFGRGFAGEVGAGYDLGLFRIEGTVGYSAANLDLDENVSGLSENGRLRSLTLGLSGYVDLPISANIVPYLGGGVGASRVDARQNRVAATPAAVTAFDDTDWGFNWHLDAGVGFNLTPATTVEVGGRYSRTTSLEFHGVGAGSAEGFRARLSSMSALLGVRQRF